MEKISSQKAKALLKQAGAAIRNLVDENRDLKEKIAAKERDERIVKIAQEMEEKGLNDELTIEAKVAALKEVENLDVTEEAIKLASPQSNMFGLSEIPGNGTHPFEHFVMTGEDPR